MATGVITGVASTLVAPVFRLLNVGGQHYYSRFYQDNEALYITLIDILHSFKDEKHNHSICKTFDGTEIAADMLCFRNPAGWSDCSDRARMKVRIQYNQMTRAVIVMCKKKYQLESFLNKFAKQNFNPAGELTLIGSS
jgi:hypothetical protein